MTATSRARARVPLEQRSIVPNTAGIPWWAAVLCAVALAFVGYIIDAARGRELTSVFAIFFFLGCLGAVLMVQQRSVFTAMIQPPLILVIAVPLAYETLTGSSHGLKNMILDLAVPLVDRFPLMIITTVVTVAIGGARIFLQNRQRARPATTDSSTGRRTAAERGGRRRADRPRPVAEAAAPATQRRRAADGARAASRPIPAAAVAEAAVADPRDVRRAAPQPQRPAASRQTPPRQATTRQAPTRQNGARRAADRPLEWDGPADPRRDRAPVREDRPAARRAGADHIGGPNTAAAAARPHPDLPPRSRSRRAAAEAPSRAAAEATPAPRRRRRRAEPDPASVPLARATRRVPRSAGAPAPTSAQPAASRAHGDPHPSMGTPVPRVRYRNRADDPAEQFPDRARPAYEQSGRRANGYEQRDGEANGRNPRVERGGRPAYIEPPRTGRGWTAPKYAPRGDRRD